MPTQISNTTHQLLHNIINIILFIAIIAIFIAGYYLLLRENYTAAYARDGFESSNSSNTSIDLDSLTNVTIYERSLAQIGNKEIAKNILLPSSAVEKFETHLFKNPDGTILGVFNDGYVYSKTSMTTGIWKGPLENNSKIALRMLTISPNANEYIAVGRDNYLYIKRPNSKGELDITTYEWEKVANNNGLIYVICDIVTRKLIGVNTNGNLMIKRTLDITSDFIELPKLTYPVLKLYYDNNDYMLVLDNKFNLWQMSDKEWQTGDINVKKGNNPTKINDLIYDNDGLMYGLVYPLSGSRLKLMKQNTYYYLSLFMPILYSRISSDSINYVLNDNSVILAKSGVDYSKTEYVNDAELDDDLEHAKIRNDLENKQKLRRFCSIKKLEFDPKKYENYDITSSLAENDRKIAELNAVITQLKNY